MIAQLTGVVARLEGNSVVLDVGGVGYRVMVPLTVLAAMPEAGGKTTLYTTMVVREDDISLYGFRAPDEQHLFGILQSVAGVGPRVALSMLSVHDPAELARVISTNDTRSLTKVPGVGPKLAQRICLELGERVAELAFEQRIGRLSGQKTSAENEAYEDVVEALVNLGYSRPDSRKAADRAMAAAADKTQTAAIIREALNLLAGTGRR